jgi:hypothetical protein
MANATAGPVPDGNATAIVVVADGADRTATVVDDVFSIDVPRGARTLIDTSAAGHLVRQRL